MDEPRMYELILPQDIQRFVAHVRVTDTGCWAWQAHHDRKGYGQFKWRGRARWAHRWIYELLVGPIEPGMTIHHRCTNTGCVNPAHLEQAARSHNTIEGNHRRNGNGIVNAEDLPV